METKRARNQVRIQKAANPSLIMEHNNQKGLRQIQQFLMEQMENYFRMLLKIKNLIIRRQIITKMVNNNSWGNEIRKIKVSKLRPRLEARGRNKLIQ